MKMNGAVDQISHQVTGIPPSSRWPVWAWLVRAVLQAVHTTPSMPFMFSRIWKNCRWVGSDIMGSVLDRVFYLCTSGKKWFVYRCLDPRRPLLLARVSQHAYIICFTTCWRFSHMNECMHDSWLKVVIYSLKSWKYKYFSNIPLSFYFKRHCFNWSIVRNTWHGLTEMDYFFFFNVFCSSEERVFKNLGQHEGKYMITILIFGWSTPLRVCKLHIFKSN